MILRQAPRFHCNPLLWVSHHQSHMKPGPSPALRDGDEVAEHLHGDEQGGLQEQAAQHQHADQGSLGTLHSQVLGRTRPTHQHRHGGGDDQVKEEELEVAQVGVDLGRRSHPLAATRGLGRSPSGDKVTQRHRRYLGNHRTHRVEQQDGHKLH